MLRVTIRLILLAAGIVVALNIVWFIRNDSIGERDRAARNFELARAAVHPIAYNEIPRVRDHAAENAPLPSSPPESSRGQPSSWLQRAVGGNG